MQVGLEHLPVFGVDGARHDDPLAAVRPHSHQGGFRERGGAVIEGCVGHFHSRQLADERLEFEDRLQRALADFRLVRGVGGIKLAAGYERIHHGRAEVVISSGAQEAGEIAGILRGSLFEVPQDFRLRLARPQPKCPLQTERRGDGGKQLVHGFAANLLQHLLPFLGRFGKITHLDWFLFLSEPRASASGHAVCFAGMIVCQCAVSSSRNASYCSAVSNESSGAGALSATLIIQALP